MTTTLSLTLLITYILGVVIMFIVPAGWMPKGNTTDRAVNKKGFGRKVFIIGGAIVLVIVLLISYFVS
jgi:hypothetical protein